MRGACACGRMSSASRRPPCRPCLRPGLWPNGTRWRARPCACHGRSLRRDGRRGRTCYDWSAAPGIRHSLIPDVVAQPGLRRRLGDRRAGIRSSRVTTDRSMEETETLLQLNLGSDPLAHLGVRSGLTRTLRSGSGKARVTALPGFGSCVLLRQQHAPRLPAVKKW
jgi:hypothetical protein